MSDVTLYGFQVSTYVNVARLVLTHKNVPYAFNDMADVMGTPNHLALHPFNRVPILRHGDFVIYETAAIISYVDEAFPGDVLTPSDPRARARMNQWISALSAYYYPYIAFHLGHERLIYPALDIAPDEKVVANALPRIRLALAVMENALRDDPFLAGEMLSLADFALLPTLTTLSFTPEGPEMLREMTHIGAWRARMDALQSVSRVRAEVAPHIGRPLEHARNWAASHRPRY